MSGMKQIIAAIGKNDGLSLLLPKEALLHQFSAIVERSHSIFSLAAGSKRLRTKWTGREACPTKCRIIRLFKSENRV